MVVLVYYATIFSASTSKSRNTLILNREELGIQEACPNDIGKPRKDGAPSNTTCNAPSHLSMHSTLKGTTTPIIVEGEEKGLKKIMKDLVN